MFVEWKSLHSKNGQNLIGVPKKLAIEGRKTIA
jgi:hypothetical protein